MRLWRPRVPCPRAREDRYLNQDRSAKSQRPVSYRCCAPQADSIKTLRVKYGIHTYTFRRRARLRRDIRARAPTLSANRGREMALRDERICTRLGMCLRNISWRETIFDERSRRATRRSTRVIKIFKRETRDNE